MSIVGTAMSVILGNLAPLPTLPFVGLPSFTQVCGDGLFSHRMPNRQLPAAPVDIHTTNVPQTFA